MKPHHLRGLLAASLLINLGVILAIAYRLLLPPAAISGISLPQHLQLSETQKQQWHASEAGFLSQLAADTEAIRQHRDRMIRSIFSANPDADLIETERRAIARKQDEQQKQVIQQLLRERELLLPTQRERLMQLLLSQPVGPSSIEQLHRD